MRVVKRCRELFDGGLFCAESVLLAFAEEQGLDSEIMPGIATGFCGGVARTAGICGAVSGGVMAIGLVAGRSVAADSELRCSGLVPQRHREFAARFGSVNCAELLGLHLGVPEELERYRAEGLLQSRCALFAEGAAQITATILKGEHHAGA